MVRAPIRFDKSKRNLALNNVFLDPTDTIEVLIKEKAQGKDSDQISQYQDGNTNKSFMPESEFSQSTDL